MYDLQQDLLSKFATVQETTTIRIRTLTLIHCANARTLKTIHSLFHTHTHTHTHIHTHTRSQTYTFTNTHAHTHFSIVPHPLHKSTHTHSLTQFPFLLFAFPCEYGGVCVFWIVLFVRLESFRCCTLEKYIFGCGC